MVMGKFKTLVPALILVGAVFSVSGNSVTEYRTSSVKVADALNRVAFYKAMREKDKAAVNSQLKDLEKSPKGLDAFIGAMTMKAAGLGGDPASKLSLFKKGHKLLEVAIQKEPDNAEYRFLRLMIQENAPGILGYHGDVQKDSEYIRKSYKSLPNDVQQAIVDYNKKSKNLKLEVS
jgi:hypothetical protein